jgi:nicotinamide riboside kinase
MRIYFSGAESTGKTTLARYTANKYKLEFLPETARVILAENDFRIDALRADVDMTNRYQKLVFDRQIKEEKRASSSWVSDRSLIDVASYSLQYSTIAYSLLTSQEWMDYVSEMQKVKPIVFFIRPNKSMLSNDGIRETVSYEKVIAIDATIKTLLQLCNIQYHQIHTDSAQERTQIIDQILLRA